MQELIRYVGDKKLEFEIKRFRFDDNVIYITLLSDNVGEIRLWKITCRAVFKFRFTSPLFIDDIEVKTGLLILGDTYVSAGKFECECEYRND